MKAKQVAQRTILIASICLMTAIAVTLGVIWSSGAKAPVFSSYEKLSQEREWDAKLEKALEVAHNTGSVLSTIPIFAYHDAYRIVYELGPEVVPYILDKVEESGQNGFDQMFLVKAAAYNLQLYELYRPEDTSVYADVLEKHNAHSPQNYAFFFRVFLDEVPELVNKICDSRQPQEQKLQALDRLGMAALPYLAQRIEKGETQWKVCFENQLLGLSTDERFEHLNLQELSLNADHLENPEAIGISEMPKTVDDFYAMKQPHVKPVDVDKWIGDHAVTLDAVQYACER